MVKAQCSVQTCNQDKGDGRLLSRGCILRVVLPSGWIYRYQAFCGRALRDSNMTFDINKHGLNLHEGANGDPLSGSCTQELLGT